jgi:hypothetical protein
MTPVRWKSFECDVRFQKEKVRCDANSALYKGQYPDDLDGRQHGTGSCLEFQTHAIDVREEWNPAWNEVTLRAAFNDEMLTADKEDVLQEVEIGYRVVEKEDGTVLADRYYYPLMRVPIFYSGPGIPKTGTATRAFLGLEVDYEANVRGRYWFSYNPVQVSVLNASVPTRTKGIDEGLIPHDGASEPQGIAHVVFTIEDFSKLGTEAVPFYIPFMKTLGQIAGIGALLVWFGYRFHGPGIDSNWEESSSRVVVYSKVDDEDDDEGGSHHLEESDVEAPERRTLINRHEQSQE